MFMRESICPDLIALTWWISQRNCRRRQDPPPRRSPHEAWLRPVWRNDDRLHDAQCTVYLGLSNTDVMGVPRTDAWWRPGQWLTLDPQDNLPIWARSGPQSHTSREWQSWQTPQKSSISHLHSVHTHLHLIDSKWARQSWRRDRRT